MARHFHDLLTTIEALLNEARHHELPTPVRDLLARLLREYESLTGLDLSK